MSNNAAVREVEQPVRRDTSNFPVKPNVGGPQEGQNLVVELPGERLQVVVAQVIDDTHLIVELTSQPFGKGHQYTKGDFIPCELRNNALEYVWTAYKPQPKRKHK